jgi:hypothetical protein
LALIVAAGSLASGCNGDQPAADPLVRVLDAAARTTAAGPAAVAATVVGDRGEYALKGAIDPEGGYRLAVRRARSSGP